MQIIDCFYGKINIPNDYKKNIIDSPGFERLRSVKQTSYAILGDHTTRFEHSIGVYYLGCLVFENIKKKYLNNGIMLNTLSEIEETFILACLLHDFGHLPFSHIGESMLLEDEQIKNNGIRQIFKEIIKFINNEEFNMDLGLCIEQNGERFIALHELLSIILSMKQYADYFETQKVDCEFFTRLILGCTYSKSNKKNNLKNAFICLLHGNGLDLDFIDCVIRGTKTTHYIVNTDINNIISMLRNIKIFSDSSRYHLSLDEQEANIFMLLCNAYQYEVINYHKNPRVILHSLFVKNIMRLILEDIKKDPSLIFLDKSIMIGIEKLCFLNDKLIEDKAKEFFNKKEIISKELIHKLKPMWESYVEYKKEILPLGEYEKILLNNLNKLNCFNGLIVIDNNLISKIKNDQILSRKDRNHIIFMINQLETYCKDRNKKFQLYYVSIKGYDLFNEKIKNSNWCICYNEQEINFEEFYKKKKCNDIYNCNDFYYLYSDKERGLSIEEWKNFLINIKKYNLLYLQD